MTNELSGVWMYSGTVPLVEELASAASERAGDGSPVVGVTFGDDGLEERYRSIGVDEIIELGGEHLDTEVPHSAAAVLAEAATELDPVEILIGATPRGTELAGLLAGLLDTGCVNEVISFDSGEDPVTMDRVTYGGEVVSTVAVEREPRIATIDKGAFNPADDLGGDPTVHTWTVENGESPITVLDHEPSSEEVDLTTADVIVSIGRGVEEEEDIEIVQELVDAIQQRFPDLNVELGCSRPICDDLGWLPEERQVGLSGAIVAPQLYVAIGISGAVQHTTGIRDADTVVAVNNDRSEPIFNAADYGIVDDLYEVVPAFTEMIESS